MPEVLYACADRLKERRNVPDGLSLRDMAALLCPGSEDFPAPTIAVMEGAPVLRRDGGWDVPIRGGATVVVFVELPLGGGGGGSNPLTVIFAVAAIAVTIWNPGLGIAGMMGLTGTTASVVGGVMTGLMAGGIVALGGVIAGAPRLSQGQVGAFNAAAASPTYNVNASGNMARLYQPEPEGFGRMLIVPDYVGRYWMQYNANDQYGYFLYGLGRGTYEVESLQYGDTVFWRDGRLVPSGYTSEDGEPYARQLEQQLLTSGQGGGWAGPWAAVPAGAAARTFTAVIEFPDGLCGYVGTWEDKHYDDHTGQWVEGHVAWTPVSISVSVEMQYREIDDAGRALSDWKPLMAATWRSEDHPKEKRNVRFYSARSSLPLSLFDWLDWPKPFSLSLTGAVPVYGRYEFRARNASAFVPDASYTVKPEKPWTHTPPVVETQPARQRVVLKSLSCTTASAQVQICEPGQPVTLFPDNVITASEVGGQELFGPNEAEYEGFVGPYVTNPPGTKTDHILIDMVAPQGVGRYDDQGNLGWYTVSWEYQYQAIDDYGNAVSGWATLSAGAFDNHTMTPQRVTLTCPVAPGRYQVQGRRTSNSTGDGRTLDTLQWTAMRAMLPGTLTYPQSVVAVKLKASNAMSQAAAGKFKALLTRKLPLYDPDSRTWSAPTPTRSWAAAVCAVCKAEWGGNIGDEQIDLDALWDIDRRLEARGWRYDAYLDGAYNVWQLVTEMCQAVLCIPRMLGTIVSAVEDRPGRPAQHLLHPRNIRRGSFRLTWNTWSEQTPDDVTVAYLDAAAGYQQRDVTAVLPESESREPSSLNVLGVVDREHAFGVAVGYAARNRWRRVVAECEVEGLGRMLLPGEVCSVAHPRFRDTVSGTLESWDAAALALNVKVEAGEVPESGDLYLALTAPEGTLWGPVRLLSCREGRAFLDPEDHAALLVQGQGNPFAWLSRGERSLPTVWTIQTARTFSRRMIVLSVRPLDLWRHSVTLINDDDRVGSYGALPVPLWQGRGQLPVVDSLDAPRGLAVAVGGGDDDAPVLNASWQTVVGAVGYEVEYSSDGAAWARQGRVTISAISVVARSGPAWLRVAAVSENLQSAWTVWRGDSSVTRPVAPVLDEPVYAGARLRLAWEALPEAENYTVNLEAGGLAVRSAAGLTEPLFEYAPDQAKTDGGPWRTLTIKVFGVNAAGPGDVAALEVGDAVPAEITDVDVETGADSVTLNGVAGPEPVGEGDVTGYVILRGAGPDFDAGSVAEMRVAPGLPFTWGGLSPGETYWFRMAAKDAFYDAAPDYGSLRYSAVLTVTLPENEDQSGGVEEHPEEGGNG